MLSEGPAEERLAVWELCRRLDPVRIRIDGRRRAPQLGLFQVESQTVPGKHGTSRAAGRSSWSMDRIEGMFYAEAHDAGRVEIRLRHHSTARRADTCLVHGVDAMWNRA